MQPRLAVLAAVITATLLTSFTAAAQWVEVTPGSLTTNIFFPRKVGIGSTTAPVSSLLVAGATSDSILKLTASDGSGALSANIMSAEWSNLGFSVDRVGNSWIARDPVVGWLVKQSGTLSVYGASGQTVNSAIPIEQVHRFFDINLTTGNAGLSTVPHADHRFVVTGSYAGSAIKLNASDGTGALTGNVMSGDWSNLGFSVERNATGWTARDVSVGWLAKQANLFSFYAATGQTANSAVNMSQVRSLMDINLTTGNVGIGLTPHAEHRLIVSGPAGTTTFPGNPYNMAIVDTNAATTANTGSGIIFGAPHTTGQPYTTIAAISAVKESTSAGNALASLTFGTRGTDFGGGVSMERMRIRSTGEVVIGPTGGTGQRLTVNGNATVNGTLTGATVIGAVYQDLAEWVPASMDMLPGTVVVLDPGVNNQVMPSHRPYDTSVAGVVSAQPGLILGVPAATKEQIATTGRVRVKVDASSSPIAIGDILVTSGKSGMAMKSQPLDLGGIALHRPGTVVGKALEPLVSGEGEILVLLSLQ